MKTLIFMLFLMIAPYLIMRALSAITHRNFDIRSAASFGVGILFIFTAIGHFFMADQMVKMLPPWVPQRELLMYLSGIFEIALAVGFFIPTTRLLAGWVTSIFLVLIFPANIYAAINQIPVGGHVWGPVYLLVRTPVQIIILFWIYWFTIRKSS